MAVSASVWQIFTDVWNVFHVSFYTFVEEDIGNVHIAFANVWWHNQFLLSTGDQFEVHVLSMPSSAGTVSVDVHVEKSVKFS